MAEASGRTMMLLVVFLAVGGLTASAAPTLQTNITSLTSNSQAVFVSAINVTSPAANDAIALVIPANNTNYTATPPQKFKWIQSDPNYLSSGTGSVTFQIYNSHSDFKFILARNVQEWSTGNFTVAAETPAIPIANPQLPGQIHLLLTNITGQVAVQWTTLQQAAGAVVQYGTTSGQYSSSANATFDTYTASQMCGGEAATTGYLFPGVFNNALMTNLSASTQYFYRVGNPATNFSAEHNFTTAPVDGQGPVQFLAIADLGYCETDSSLEWESDYPNPITYTPPGTLAALKVEFDNAWEGNWLSFCAAREVANAMIADPNKGTLLVHNGDISYAQGFTYGWDVYWDMMQPLISHIPYMAVQGNHERDWPNTGDRYLQENAKDSGGECGVVFEKRIPMPIPHPGQQWYTFTYGPIFFIQFSTEIDFGEGSAQHDFIYNALKSVNRTTFPWLVVGFHRPYLEPSVYGPNNKADIQNQQDLQAAFDDIFFQYQVDMTWFGHTHWYSRSCPVYKKQCQPPASDGSQTAPVHVNIGNAGASFSWDVVDPAVLTQDIYSAFAIQHGYLRVNASRTSLHIQAVNSLDGTLLDDYTLTKPAGWAANSTRQTATMTNFVGNFTSTWYESYGGDQYGNNILDAAEAQIFASNTSILATLANMTALANPVTGPTAFESFQNANPIWQALNTAFLTVVSNTTSVSSTTLYFYQKIYGPLFDMFQQFPNGVFKGPMAGTPLTITTPAGVQLPQQQIPANLVSYNPPVTSSSTPSTSTSNSSLATAPAGSAGGTAVANLTSSGVASTATGSGSLATNPGANNTATSG